MKKILIFAGILAAVCWYPAQAMGQEGAYINAEYWTCPTENLEALSQASDTIWGPIFDELVEEGRITSWISLAPISFVKVEDAEDGRAVTEMPAAWNWATSWTAPSEEAFDSAWALFEERLVEKFPADPRPFLFCESVMVVTYWVRPH